MREWVRCSEILKRILWGEGGREGGASQFCVTFSSKKHMSGLDDQIHCGSGTVIAGASIAKKPKWSVLKEINVDFSLSGIPRDFAGATDIICNLPNERQPGFKPMPIS